jgi:hypothetical protein
MEIKKYTVKRRSVKEMFLKKRNREEVAEAQVEKKTCLEKGAKKKERAKKSSVVKG